MISLNIVVYKEYKRLQERLPSLTKFFEDIVIVDQCSGDGSRELCQSYGVTFIEDYHYGYCEPSRFLASFLSRGDWILVLDADEYPTDKFLEDMISLTQQGFDGYILPIERNRQNELLEEKYRFFRKHFCIYQNRLHTNILPLNNNVIKLDYTAIVEYNSEADRKASNERYRNLINSGVPLSIPMMKKMGICKDK